MANLNYTMNIEDSRLIRILGMDFKYFAGIFVILTIGIFFGFTSKGMVFSIPILLMYSFLFNEIGNRIPIFNEWVGGGIVLNIFLGAFITSYLPKPVFKNLETFYVIDDFLIFVIGNLILCSIMGMNRAVLIRAAFGYIPTLLAATAGAYLLTGLIGVVAGYGFWEAVLFIAQPIMGGGMGAGAIPMAKIYASAGKNSAEFYMSTLAASVVVGNVLAIIGGAVLNKIGEWKPSLTGNGNLVETNQAVLEKPAAETEKPEITPAMIGMITACVGAFIVLGFAAGKLVPIKVHPYAWMIILCVAAKCLNVFPQYFMSACRVYLPKFLEIVIPPIMIGVGMFYTDLKVFFASISDPVFVLLCICTIVGAIAGAGFFGRLFKFYFVESALTAGLCMANMGGSGDVAVLSAAKRMELLPFAQISSRLGGAIILIISGFMLGVLK